MGWVGWVAIEKRLHCVILFYFTRTNRHFIFRDPVEGLSRGI
jgi:hypothetical protein